MEQAVEFESFNGDNMTTVKLTDEVDARVNTLISHAFAGRSADQHGTSPAITFFTDDLRADHVPSAAKQVG